MRSLILRLLLLLLLLLKRLYSRLIKIFAQKVLRTLMTTSTFWSRGYYILIWGFPLKFDLLLLLRIHNLGSNESSRPRLGDWSQVIQHLFLSQIWGSWKCGGERIVEVMIGKSMVRDHINFSSFNRQSRSCSSSCSCKSLSAIHSARWCFDITTHVFSHQIFTSFSIALSTTFIYGFLLLNIKGWLALIVINTSYNNGLIILLLSS
jgi:hypothetical protein